MSNVKLELEGKTFGRLMVLSLASSDRSGRRWNCICDCGTSKIVIGSALNRGATTSCGCYHKEALNRPRLAKGVSGYNMLLDSYRRGATKRGHSFTLTDAQFRRLTKSNCFYCGAEPALISSNNKASTAIQCHSAYTYNGIDRVDNAKGYEENNTVSCCRFCNWSKGSLSVGEFLDNINRIAKHNE